MNFSDNIDLLKVEGNFNKWCNVYEGKVGNCDCEPTISFVPGISTFIFYLLETKEGNVILEKFQKHLEIKKQIKELEKSLQDI